MAQCCGTCKWFDGSTEDHHGWHGHHGGEEEYTIPASALCSLFKESEEYDERDTLP